MFSYNNTLFCEDYPPEEKVLTEFKKMYKDKIDIDPSSYVTTASCFWDPEPRTTNDWIQQGYYYDKEGAVWYLSPEKFREHLKDCKELTDSLSPDNPGRKIIMIDNWNEWDEGHFVAPSHKFGFKYLQAIREELTNCDNLPDYRMPQDIGLSNFNETWDTPDMTDICKKKFNLK